jgi:hypothetical protein
MTDERVTVYSPRFSVPGAIIETGLGTVRISYHAPGEQKPRKDWFYALNAHGKRAGVRMGDLSDDAVHYSVSPAMRDEAA